MTCLASLEDLEFLRETLDLECKAAQGREGSGELPASVWESYSAMANTAGGEIYLGIEETKDHRFICRGIKDPAKVIKAFWDGVRSRKVVNADILSANDVETVELGDSRVIRISVPRANRKQRPIFVGENPLTGTYIRRQEGDYRAGEETVKRIIAEAVEDTRDDRILLNYGIDDLSMESVMAYRKRFGALKPESPWIDLDLTEFLRSIGAFRKERSSGEQGLTVAGLLMFGRYETITEQFPHYMVDYQERPEPKRELRWIDRIVPDGTWSGNLFDFYQRTIKKLSADLKVPFALSGPTRIDDTPVHGALREALTNTLIHADYTGRLSILVVKRPDMFGFRNPGLMRIGIEQACRGGISDCRNHRLQDMFRYIGLGDHAGSGLPSILKSWKSQHWRAPLLHEDREHEQTLLELRTSSLFPEETMRELSTMFGERFTGLSELARIALATAMTEGVVTHGRLKTLATEHPTEITTELVHLVREGFLEKRGKTRSSVYSIAGIAESEYTLDPDSFASAQASQELPGSPEIAPSLPDLAVSSPDLTPSLPDLTGVLHEALREMGYPRMPGKLDEAKVRRLIRILCGGRWLTARQLGEILHRESKSLKDQYLSKMIAAKEIGYRYPETENHPGQAYRTIEATR